jgi:NAD(P)-dependent dehydrogenase (short-subunit alcohol dehydrogenase family)
MTQPLGGRRILVTGGATGIGAAAVQVLSEAGAAVVATYHRTPPADREGVSWVQCDVRDAALVDEMVKGAAGKVSAIALAPAVQTPGADRLREFLGPAAADFIDEQIKSTIPLGGALGDPVDDLGPTLVFLAGEGSRFITGQLIAVDGGLVMLGA